MNERLIFDPKTQLSQFNQNLCGYSFMKTRKTLFQNNSTPNFKSKNI